MIDRLILYEWMLKNLGKDKSIMGGWDNELD